MNSQSLQLELAPPLARLWLNRPHRANALNREMVDQFSAHVETLVSRDDVRVLILRGRDGKFSSGADLKELVEHAQGPAAELSLAATLERLAALPMIAVAVIEQFALGGGFLIPLYCDLRIAAPDAQLGFTSLSRHWIPPWGLSRLAGWLGPARAQQFLLIHGAVSAEQGLELGLVDRVIAGAQLDAELENMVDKLAQCPREVIREVKTYYAQWKGAAHSHWDRISAAGFTRTWTAPSAQAAIAHFVGGRKAERDENTT